jgi:DNA polymerase III alpha subunit
VLLFFQELFLVYLVNYLIKENLAELLDLYKKLKLNFGDRFYIEIQRHDDQNESGFEKFNLNKSSRIRNSNNCNQ